MKRLYRKDEFSSHSLSNTEKYYLEKFEETMTDKDNLFPCIPATIGYTLHHFCYGFLGDPRKTETVDELAHVLTEFSKSSKKLGNYTSLIVFYDIPQEMKDSYTIEQYEQLFWNHLSDLTNVDKEKWPEEIPTDPHNSLWEFCFHREKYFMYCATPAHTNRKSRYFPTMMLAITPRWVLTEFNNSPTHAQNIKYHIRARLENYDSISIHPDLNSYGESDNFEWKQYFLRDDDSSLTKCPFRHLWKSSKKD
ncbi:YqcI/YcgG family protein [Evansella sp. AB-rgal1]|uniref:YqcI/YcgG family protein n=1 Tax=Evansella sp. AB-rgal1 TaxID=3242696 RepID=UPI00359EA37B